MERRPNPSEAGMERRPTPPEAGMERRPAPEAGVERRPNLHSTRALSRGGIARP